MNQANAGKTKEARPARLYRRTRREFFSAASII